MKSRISIGLALLLAACGGSGYRDDGYAIEAGPPPGASAAPEAYGEPAPREIARDYGQDRRYAGTPGAAYPEPGRAEGNSRMPEGELAAVDAGPRGTSQRDPGEARYDELGYAGVRGVAGGAQASGAAVAVHRNQPVDTVLEVTSIETGRTILVLVTGTMPPGSDHPMDLSPGAAAALGGGAAGAIPVRMRKVNAAPQDMALLRAGRPAGERPDAPPVLLNALRRNLPQAAARPPVPVAAPQWQPARAPARPAAGPGFYVQVAALSNAARAEALARALGGSVRAGGGLYRVRMGPYGSRGQAEAARANAAAQGYGDATIVTN